MKKGLGKGLEALFPDSDQNISEIKEIDINLIDPDKNQPRKNFDKEKLINLANSIKEHGIVQPVIVRKDKDRFIIIAGERRWRAARIAKFNTIPVLIKNYGEREIMEIALVENLQREDLNPIEEAEAYEKLINNFEMTQEKISQIVGKSRPAIANTLRLLSLEENIKNLIINKKLSGGHARCLLSIEGNKRNSAAEEIIKKELSVRDTEKFIKKIINEEKKERKTTEKEQIVDEVVLDIENKLKNIFSTNVKFEYGAAKGKLIIEYYSKEEMERIIAILLSCGNF